ncbi:hypothetical protein [Aureivirga sp. CE67]|uniref:hypothetical protein n=1 Tax=Aureivirga sp. CE67 TaxID=1788983 RepID=UPI0018CB35D3|nr:hypothetical protein [Aureivirga sp. CE67]
MKADILIESNLFPSYKGEEELLNSGRFGKRLAEFLKSELEKENIIIKDLYPTDYSFELRIDQFEFEIFILTGNIDGELNKYLISIEPKKEFVRKWFRKIPSKKRINELYKIIEKKLTQNEEINII